MYPIQNRSKDHLRNLTNLPWEAEPKQTSGEWVLCPVAVMLLASRDLFPDLSHIFTRAPVIRHRHQSSIIVGRIWSESCRDTPPVHIYKILQNEHTFQFRVLWVLKDGWSHFVAFWLGTWQFTNRGEYQGRSFYSFTFYSVSRRLYIYIWGYSCYRWNRVETTWKYLFFIS